MDSERRGAAMSDNVIDLIRGVNPFPDELPAPPIQPVMRRLEGGDQGSRSSARMQLRPTLDATLGALGVATVVAVAVLMIALAGHTRSWTAIRHGATSTSAAPPRQDNLTGTWRGLYTGVYGSGTLTISWQQSAWKEGSPGIWHAHVNGSITLSPPSETLPIRGTVLTTCRQAPCHHGDLINFHTVVEPSLVGSTWGHSSKRGIAYKGTVSTSRMHGSYQTPNGGRLNGRGVWSARQLGQ